MGFLYRLEREDPGVLVDGVGILVQDMVAIMVLLLHEVLVEPLQNRCQVDGVL